MDTLSSREGVSGTTDSNDYGLNYPYRSAPIVGKEIVFVVPLVELKQ